MLGSMVGEFRAKNNEAHGIALKIRMAFFTYTPNGPVIGRLPGNLQGTDWTDTNHAAHRHCRESL